MSEQKTGFSPAVHEKLVETYLRIQNIPAAAMLYKMLPPAEKQKVDDNSDDLFGPDSHRDLNRTIGMWMLLRGCSQVRAIIAVSYTHLSRCH